MKALIIERPDGPEALRFGDRPEPQLGPWDLRIKVHVSALNRADLLQMRGGYPAPAGVPSDIPGLEYAGVVLECGPHVNLFKRGDPVMGLVGGGAFAEQVVVHEREALPIPPNLSFEEAAALPEAFLTAWDALVLQGGLRSGEWVLVHAAGSGVGTAAVQLVHALGGRCVATARSKGKLEQAAHAYGVSREALIVPDLEAPGVPRFADRVRSVTGGGVHLALELVGGNYVPETLAAMAPRGRVILVGLLAGATANVDLRTVLTRRLSVTGTVLRSRPLEEKLALAQAARRSLVPLFESGALKPVLDTTCGVVPMRLDAVKQACARLGRNETFGKIVLRW